MNMDPDGWMLPDHDTGYAQPADWLNPDLMLGVASVRYGVLHSEDDDEDLIILQFEVADTTNGRAVLPPFVIPATNQGWIDACQDMARWAADSTPFSSPVEVEFCPGCGVQLHGSIKYRGACLDCFPEVTEETIREMNNDEEK